MGAGAAVLTLGALASQADDRDVQRESLIGSFPQPVGSGSTPQPFVLPELGYAYEALEPHIDAHTMQIHYTKHHQTYISNANKVLGDHPELQKLTGEAILANLAAIPESIRAALRNNVGGHVNHSFFWKIIAPSNPDHVAIQEPFGPTGALAGALGKSFGSFQAFKTQFADAAVKQFGSGWAWLALKGGDLSVHSTPNQDSPLSGGAIPIVGLDVWEHAYYLKHQNLRTDYVKAFWEVVNWQQAEANYEAAVAG